MLNVKVAFGTIQADVRVDYWMHVALFNFPSALWQRRIGNQHTYFHQF